MLSFHVNNSSCLRPVLQKFSTIVFTFHFFLKNCFLLICFFKIRRLPDLQMICPLLCLLYLKKHLFETWYLCSSLFSLFSALFIFNSALFSIIFSRICALLCGQYPPNSSLLLILFSSLFMISLVSMLQRLHAFWFGFLGFAFFNYIYNF